MPTPLERPVYPSKLREKTLELLKDKARKVQLQQIAAETGLSKSWLSALHMDNKNKHQDVGRIEHLYVYLSGKQLEL